MELSAQYLMVALTTFTIIAEFFLSIAISIANRKDKPILVTIVLMLVSIVGMMSIWWTASLTHGKVLGMMEELLGEGKAS